MATNKSIKDKLKKKINSIYEWSIDFLHSIKEDRISVQNRALAMFCFLLILFSILVVQLFQIQIIHSSDKYAAQIDQLVEERELTAKRGNIYDRNMNVLVQDSSAKSINIVPKLLEDPVTVAQTLSSDLGLDYDKVYAIATQLEDDRVEISNNAFSFNSEQLLELLDNSEAYSVEGSSFYVIPIKVKNPETDIKNISAITGIDMETVKKYVTSLENTPQLIKSKVDNSIAEQIKNKLSNPNEDEDQSGLVLLDDSKRYYTNGNFASHVLGFTGIDHEGLYGVEKTYDAQLSGTKEKVYYQKDAEGNIITSQTKIVQESKSGEDLILSLDSNIQSIAEKQLQNAVNEWNAKSGTAIVMSTKTGEILAMTSKPDFDLNDPYKLSEEFQATHQSDLQNLSKDEQLQQQWKNPAVSFIYEPGSTFKPITVSSALEEGAINPSMTFNCKGTYNVKGTTIHCTGIHGEQSISEALENSCNPALVQIIQNVDPNVFYKYVYNYGFGTKTGIELTGEEEGIVNRAFNDAGEIRIVDYSTFSFGQGLATTPIQLLSALNALINNGYYVAPTIIKDGGKESPRQIVSSNTSSTLKQEMQAVVESKPELVEAKGNFTIGGKTGTAEKFVNGAYLDDTYVTSFFCFAPVDDPEYACLLVLDEPRAGAAGVTSAAPAAIEILKQALIYSGSNPDENIQANLVVPDCVGKTISEVEPILKERGITYQLNANAKGDYILAQSIPAQSPYTPDTPLILTVSEKPEDENLQTIPDFTGKSVQSVNEDVQKLGLKLKVEGTGFAVEQSIPPGTPITAGSEILVRFQE